MNASLERLYEAAGTNKHTVIAFDLNVGASTITNWGKRGISKEGALKAAEKYGTNANWLLTGDTKTSSTKFTPIDTWDSDTPIEVDEVEIVFYKDLSFACGGGSVGEALDTESRRLRMSKSTLRKLSIDRSNAFAATAKDDSMSPTINDGDTIYVDRGRTTIKDGKIFAIEHGGLFRCKRLYALPNGGVRIVSDNAEEYPEITLTAEQIQTEDFYIIGWVWSWAVLESW